MTTLEYLAEAEIRLESLKVRMAVATEGFTEAQLNEIIPNEDWPILGVAWHLSAAMNAYFPGMTEAGERASQDKGDELKFTLMGKIIHHGAGPKGSAPVPKPLMPPSRALSPDLLQTVSRDFVRLQSLAQAWRGKAVGKSKLSIPYFPLLKLSAADALELHIVHGDRHVSQMQKMADHIRRRETLKGVQTG